MRYFSYIVARDFGFAPNPFFGICTLATCKPVIRRVANIDDWIIGTGSKLNNANGKLVFAMQVNEKLTYQQYWDDNRFELKKPLMSGSLKLMYGDNIYHKDQDDNWLQENSHHTLEDGGINYRNLNTDTNGRYVLISNNFFYFGKSSIDIPLNIRSQCCMKTQGFKYVDTAVGNTLIDFLRVSFEPKKLDIPTNLIGNFRRYEGNA